MLRSAFMALGSRRDELLSENEKLDALFALHAYSQLDFLRFHD